MKGSLRRSSDRSKFLYAFKMRNETPTECETILWGVVQYKKLGFKFRRQAVIRGWIFDFWCPSKRLVIEVDGPYHKDPNVAAADRHKDRTLSNLGIFVLRFTNHEVKTQLPVVIASIVQTLESRPTRYIVWSGNKRTPAGVD